MHKLFKTLTDSSLKQTSLWHQLKKNAFIPFYFVNCFINTEACPLHFILPMDYSS